MGEELAERIFILHTKKSEKRSDTTYCVGVFRLGTDNMEFIVGETNNDKEYVAGMETEYIYNADYTSDMGRAWEWFNKLE